MRFLPALLLGASLISSSALLAAEEKLGAPLTVKEQTPIATLMSKPVRYVGRVVQVKGKVSAVCQRAGCWMTLTDSDSGATVRIKVNDGEIVFPKEAAGKTAIAEGTFTEVRLTHDQAVAQARHEAEENGRPFDPASVKGPVTYYQVKATGAIVLE